jgi:hypothetical protein
MNSDPLLSNDLAALLPTFPNDALRDLVAVLKQHKSLTPFPARRAYAAHALPVGGDLTAHATAIAEEVLWWGSHDVHRQFADAPGWIEVVTATAKHLDVPEKERGPAFPAWKIEDAVFHKAMDAWERLGPAEREAAMKKAGVDAGAAKGGMAAAAGGMAGLGARQLLAFLAARGAGAAVPFVGPVLTAVGAAWAAYDLAGPGYRLLRPATLLIAFHRRRLRDERASSAFRD